MSPTLVVILQLCLLALVYLFFLRILRAVWVEVAYPEGRPAGTRGAPRRSGGRRGVTRLVIVEPEGQAGRSFDVEGECTIGRAAGCAVTLEDTYVSQLHARVWAEDGRVLIEDLGSTNGTWVNGNRVTGPVMLRPRDRIQIGSFVLEVR